MNRGPEFDSPEFAAAITINVTWEEYRLLQDAAGATGFDPHDGMLWSVVRERALRPWGCDCYPDPRDHEEECPLALG